jgi:hypothetical protein
MVICILAMILMWCVMMVAVWLLVDVSESFRVTICLVISGVVFVDIAGVIVRYRAWLHTERKENDS